MFKWQLNLIIQKTPCNLSVLCPLISLKGLNVNSRG